MTTLTETQHAGGFIVSEANGLRSRQQVTIALGENLQPGTLLGKVTATNQYVAHDPDATDGPQAVAGILFAACNATDAAQQAVAVVRDAEVNEAELVFTGLDTAETAAAVADMLALGIVMR